MKAWRIDQHGGNEVLKWIDVADPAPRELEACVRVTAVGLNHLDLWVRKGVPGHRFPLPMIPGCDSVGVVEAWGPGAERALAGGKGASSKLRIGSRVIVSPGISCGHCRACLDGFDPLCPQYGILGETQDGGLAERVVAPIANLIPIPDHVGDAEAAATPIPYLTAWTMLMRKARLQPGETILIHAGGSGVSVAAIQIAKMIGARVITTVGSAAKAEQAQALGADHVILYRETPFRASVKQLGLGAPTVVVDHVGSDTFAESIKTLAWGGRLVTCGATTGAEVTIDLKQIFFKNISILGTTMGSKADLLQIFELVARGQLKPVVDSTLPLSALATAFDRLEAHDVFGKLVLLAE